MPDGDWGDRSQTHGHASIRCGSRERDDVQDGDLSCTSHDMRRDAAYSVYDSLLDSLTLVDVLPPASTTLPLPARPAPCR